MTESPDTALSPVLTALYEGRTADAEALVAAKPELDVFEASATGSSERLAVLLRSEPGLASSWSPDGFTPLHLAAFFGHREAVRTLLEASADPGVVSRHAQIRVTPLQSAVAREGAADIGTAEELLDGGAPVDGRGEGGGTALHSAAQNGDADAVGLLLSRGADAKAAREDGKTPVDLAREGSHAHVVQLLGG